MEGYQQQRFRREEEKTLRMKKKMREEKRQDMVESKDLTLGKSDKKRRKKTEDK